MSNHLSPDLEHLAALVDRQSPEVSEALHSLLAVAQEMSGRARLLNISQIEGRIHYSYLTIVGDLFTVVRPDIDAEMETQVRASVAAILGEQSRRTAPWGSPRFDSGPVSSREGIQETPPGPKRGATAASRAGGIPPRAKLGVIRRSERIGLI